MPPSRNASVTRSTVESKKAPRWLDEFDALASAPSSRSGSAARMTRSKPSRSRPEPTATAEGDADHQADDVRWSGVSLVFRSAAPIGRTAASTGLRNVPSNMDDQPHCSGLSCTMNSTTCPSTASTSTSPRRVGGSSAE